jgi:enoyl-CoA hydratase
MLDQNNYESILIEKRLDGVAIATLNRPERLNSVDDQMHNELERLPGDFDRDKDTRVLVVTGAGRAFCAGGDFSPDRDRSDGLRPVFVHARHLVFNWLDCEKPVISAVNGYAMGLGATVALFADIVIAARSATFADTHVNMAIGAGDGGGVFWPLLIGPHRAKYYLMTGDRMDADTAERFGLVHAVVDDDQLMKEALAIATRLAAGPAYAISASKVPINQYLKFVANIVLPQSLAMEEISMMHPDHQEAVAAFQEKRTPNYAGH